MTRIVRFQSQILLDQLSWRRLRGRFAIQSILSPQRAMQLLIRIYGNSQASTIEYCAAQGVGQSSDDLHIHKLPDQGLVCRCKIHGPIVFGASLQLPGILF